MFKQTTHTQKACLDKHQEKESTTEATQPGRITFESLKKSLSTVGILTTLLLFSSGIAGAQQLNTIALVGNASLGGIPFAAPKGDGTFAVSDFPLPDDFPFQALTALPNVKVLTGDFNGDGITDIALTGVSGWNSIPVAFSNGNGKFNVSNINVSSSGPGPNFAALASQPGVTALTGDFNCDGNTDIALVGGAGWTVVPVAYSLGDGAFFVSNVSLPSFAAQAATKGVKAVVGPFKTSGCESIALLGGPGWNAIPVATFYAGFGAASYTNAGVGNFSAFPFCAGRPGVQILTGYFTGPMEHGVLAGPPQFGIALVGVAGWQSIPVATSNGDGTFTATNDNVPNFPEWAALPGAKALALNNFLSLTSIALVGHAGWGSIPVAYANGDGTFRVANPNVLNFPTWASLPGVQILTGNFTGGFNTDIALVGVSGWGSIPVASAQPSGGFTVTNGAVASFPAWAAMPGVTALGLNQPPPPPSPVQIQ
jgi:hypothetical protein